MSLVLIADIILALIIIFKIVTGWRKGLVRAFAGLIALLCAVFGGLWLKDLLAPVIASSVFLPKAEKFVSERMDAGSQVISEQLGGFLESLRLPQAARGALGERIMEKLGDTGAGLVQAAAETLSQRLADVLVFLVCFIIIYFVVRALIRLLDGTVLRIPGLRQLNKLLGAVMGLLAGAFLAGLVLAVAFLFFPALSQPGGILAESSVAGSYLVKFYFSTFPGLFS